MHDAYMFKVSPIVFLDMLFRWIKGGDIDVQRTHIGRVLEEEILRQSVIRQVVVKVEEGND